MKKARIAVLVFIGIMLVVSIMPALATPINFVPSNPGITNLVACWDLSETSGIRYDYTDNNHDMTDYNTVGYGTGISGNAADFEKDNSEGLYISDDDHFDIGGGKFYVGAWIKLESTGLSGTVIAKWNSTPSTLSSWALYITNDVPLATVRKADNSGSITATWGSSLSSDTWYYVEFWHDSDAHKTYLNVNNSTPVNRDISGGVQDTTEEIAIGTRTDHTSLFFDGLIDTAVVYQGDFPDANEREWLYNSGSGRQCSDLNLPTDTPTATSTSTSTNTATATNTATNTATYTPTETFTPTATAIPWFLAYSSTNPANGYDSTSGDVDDTYSSNNVRDVGTEQDTNENQYVQYNFEAFGHSPLVINFEGYYTGTHTVYLKCLSYDTSSYVNIINLGTENNSDENLNEPVPEECIPTDAGDDVIIRIQQAAEGISGHQIKVDYLRLSETNPTNTPTVTATYTDTPTITSTPTLTNTPQDTSTPTATLNATQAITATYLAAYEKDKALAEENLPSVIMLSIICGLIVVVGIVGFSLWLTKNRK